MNWNIFDTIPKWFFVKNNAYYGLIALKFLKMNI